jgi:hypothetical protein
MLTLPPSFLYIQGYMDIFQSEELPTPMTILQATAEVNNLAAQVNAIDMYNKQMDDVRTTLPLL